MMLLEPMELMVKVVEVEVDVDIQQRMMVEMVVLVS